MKRKTQSQKETDPNQELLNVGWETPDYVAQMKAESEKIRRHAEILKAKRLERLRRQLAEKEAKW